MKLKQIIKETYKDYKEIDNQLNEKIKNANYYDERYLKFATFMTTIEFPIECVFRACGKQYWNLKE